MKLHTHNIILVKILRVFSFKSGLTSPYLEVVYGHIAQETIVSSELVPINHQQAGRYLIYTMDAFDVLKNTPLMGYG